MKKLLSYKWAILVLIIQAVFSGYFWFMVSEDLQIPTHWNLKGEVDAWSGKTFGILGLLGINLLLFLVLYFMPLYSVRFRKQKDRFEKVLPSVAFIIAALFALLHIVSILLAKNPGAFGERNMILVIIGVMFVLLGNLMPKLPSNFFIGIKTPWTLSSEYVWRRTHRFGGIAFVIAGVIFLITGLIKNLPDIVMITSGITAFVIIMSTIVYSFVIYKKAGEAN